MQVRILKWSHPSRQQNSIANIVGTLAGSSGWSHEYSVGSGRVPGLWHARY